ncbi:MAG: GHKL domain-containing protein [Oscillospiraceae bacterium]|nr:GHKL domain-containing protein [Oscillospiraceae bacterium]
MEKLSEIYFGISGAAEALIGYHYLGRLAGRKSFLKIIMSAIIIVTVFQLSFGTINSVIGMLSPVMIGKDPDFTAAVMILFDLLSLFLVCVSCEFILKHFSDKISDNIYGVKYLIVPLLMIFCIGSYINNILYGNTVSDGMLENVSKEAPAMIFFQVLEISAIFCILHICGEMIKNKTGSEYAELRAKEAEARLKKTRAFRHDVKNHMTVLTGLLKNGDTAGAEKYLSEMENIANNFSVRFQTGNSAADIIINSKLSEAEKKVIDITCEIKLPPCKIDDSDLCIILANAVDNAVHACERLNEHSEKFINITGISHGDIFLIEIKNSFDGEKFKWGTGLKNIRRAAEKYGGSVRISCTENIFTLSVLMNISQH